jgi:hypothetical protein
MTTVFRPKRQVERFHRRRFGIPSLIDQRRCLMAQQGGLDGMFGNTNIVVLILFGVCCGGLAFILGIIGLITCTDPIAKRNALIVTILGGIFGGVHLVLGLVRGH